MSDLTRLGFSLSGSYHTNNESSNGSIYAYGLYVYMRSLSVSAVILRRIIVVLSRSLLIRFTTAHTWVRSRLNILVPNHIIKVAKIVIISHGLFGCSTNYLSPNMRRDRHFCRLLMRVAGVYGL